MQLDDADTRLQALEIESSTDAVYRSLRDAILKGGFAAGERLVEGRLSKSLGVSRAPVREAIRMLTADGLVESAPRRGVSVASLAAADADEIYGVRTALESWAARDVALRHGDGLAHLEELHTTMERAADENEVSTLVQVDVEFHRELCRLTGNGRLLNIWDSVIRQIQLLSSYVLSSVSEDLHLVPGRHAAILASLKSQDPDKAEQVVRLHIDSARLRVLPHFSSKAPPQAAAKSQDSGAAAL